MKIFMNVASAEVERLFDELTIIENSFDSRLKSQIKYLKKIKTDKSLNDFSKQFFIDLDSYNKFRKLKNKD